MYVVFGLRNDLCIKLRNFCTVMNMLLTPACKSAISTKYLDWYVSKQVFFVVLCFLLIYEKISPAGCKGSHYAMSVSVCRLECDAKCAILERNKRIAFALEIQNPELDTKLSGPKYSDFLKDMCRYESFCQQPL